MFKSRCRIATAALDHTTLWSHVPTKQLHTMECCYPRYCVQSHTARTLAVSRCPCLGHKHRPPRLGRVFKFNPSRFLEGHTPSDRSRFGNCDQAILLPRSFLGQSLSFYSAFVDYDGAVLKKEAPAGRESCPLSVRPACRCAILSAIASIPLAWPRYCLAFTVTRQGHCANPDALRADGRCVTARITHLSRYPLKRCRSKVVSGD
jgi:hypothetical protein